jgi:uncharacterized alpha-E superfamily protein
MGRFLERADKTSRILDVKYFVLLPDVSYVGTPLDYIQWNALLRSASAFEMYRKRYGRIDPSRVVEFLLLDGEFPRAVRFCVARAEESLRAITGSPMGSYGDIAEQELGRLRAELDFADVDSITESGVHEFLDALQASLNNVGDGIFETFFALRPVEGAMSVQRQEQIQT